MSRLRGKLWSLMPLALGVMALSALSVTACSGEATIEEEPEPSVTSSSIAPPEKVTHDFVIPAGTAVRIARGIKGEELGIIPGNLTVRVGERIRVRNDDSELMRLGIFDVSPGETVTMNFNTVGKLEGVIFADEAGGCGVPPGDTKSFVIDVRP